jgi:PBSX family phage terminase large subunit
LNASLNQSALKLSTKQKLAIASASSKINIWSGAVRSGKSYSATLRFLVEVTEAPPGDMAIITRDANSFRRNVLPILHDLIGMDADYKAGLSLIELWGRRIHLVGCHDQRSEGKLRGCTLQAALVDEASLIPESSWIVLLQRIAMNNGRIFATTNPDSSLHWLKTGYIDNNPDVRTFDFGLLDNPRLADEERAFLQRQHRGIWYRRFIKGEWCMAEGAVFDFFDEKIHTIQRPPANAKFHLVGVDIGFTNPSAFILLGCNPDVSPSLWIEAEYYWDSKKQGRQKTDAEYASDLIEFLRGRNVKFIYIDPAAASFKIEARRAGIQTPIRDAENSVTEGIRTLSSFFSQGDLKIVRSCRNLIGEIQGYCWDSRAAERGEDAPIKRADHAIDALRYGIYSYFGNRIFLS